MGARNSLVKLISHKYHWWNLQTQLVLSVDKTRLAGQEQVNPGEMFVLVQIWFPEHLVTPETEHCSKKL